MPADVGMVPSIHCTLPIAHYFAINFSAHEFNCIWLPCLLIPLCFLTISMYFRHTYHKCWAELGPPKSLQQKLVTPILKDVAVFRDRTGRGKDENEHWYCWLVFPYDNKEVCVHTGTTKRQALQAKKREPLKKPEMLPLLSATSSLKSCEINFPAIMVFWGRGVVCLFVCLWVEL